MQSCRVQYHWIIYKTTPSPKSQETFEKRGPKDDEGQRTKEFSRQV